MVTALITVAALAWLCQMALAAGKSTSLTARLMPCVRKVASESDVPADASNRGSSWLLRWMKTITSAIHCSCAA
ncbi:hypothetical protein GVv1_36750 [Enterobacter pseudoroggenkampii]